VVSILTLAAVAAGMWFAPDLAVLTPLRDRPLALAFAGIDGSIASSSARWRWVGGVEYRDVVVRDRAGRPAVIVPRLLLDRGVARIAFDRGNLGTVRLVDPEALVEVRGDGSSLEDVLAPWLARSGSAPALEFEVLNGTIEFVDVARRDAWRLSDVIAAGTLLGDGGIAGWTAAGRLRHSGGLADQPPSPATPTAPTTQGHLDRSTIPTAAAAVLVREGGWTISSPPPAADGSRAVTVAGHRVPLGFSSVVASRFGLPQLVDGIADVRLDITNTADGPRAQGSVTVEQFAVCDATDLAERFAIERCDVPFDLSVMGDRLVVRRLAAVSPLARADLVGSVRLPGGDLLAWLDGLAADDFTLSVDVDLAAAAVALPDGLRVRPDVRVTAGNLRIAAAARADGADRLLEVRATARDLAAERAAAGAAAAATLSWPEPFTSWIKVRRGAGGDAMRIEEARLVAAAAELSATGGAEGFGVQWTADLGAIATGLAEVLDLGVSAKGASRGRVDCVTGGAAGPSRLTVAAEVSDLEVSMPGVPAWRDAEVAIEAEAEGSLTGGLAAVERARGLVACGADRLEASITGGVLVDLPAVAGIAVTRGVPWIRPAARAESVAAECSLAGDLAGWLPRLAVIAPGTFPADLEAAGRTTASAVVAARGDAWHFDRAVAEIEKLSATWRGRQIMEPRVIATLAGRIESATGRVVLSSAEVLSATLSLRSSGLSWEPTAQTLDRLRGRMQWQADLPRLERWLVTPDHADRWPTSGRAWGTVEIADTQAGVNVLVEATGSQVALAAAAAGRPLWVEPRPTVALEVTRPTAPDGRDADALVVDRLAVESSTLAVSARGAVSDLASRRIVSLEGTAAYDWDQVSRLLTPWTGGRVRLAGAGGRPFTIRGPLGVQPRPVGGEPPETASVVVPLPSDWLSATRGSGDTATELSARLARPVSSSAPASPLVVRNLALDTSAAWSAGDLDGIALAPGEMAVRLLEGQLAFGPFDVPAAGGRLRSAPWIRLEPWPGELIVPPGRVVERVALSGAVCDRWVRWLVPVLGHSTHTSGVVSIDLAGARVPLADPFTGELAGQAVFEELEVRPGGGVQPLVNLIVKLQSVVDPRFAFGDKAVIMRVRPEPVRMRLAGRRLAHDGLVMDAGQLVVKSQGSVGQDGSLDMLLEVALRGDLVGQTPVLGQLFRTPLVVPLKGTVHRPQFDAAEMDKILGRIVENTAEAVIKDGIGRGLEAVFGAPGQPAPTGPPSPQGLVLPPR